MKYPLWRCRRCGERLYARVDGDYHCPNCGRRYDPAELEEETP